MFKKDFLWGVATASYQIEGGAYEDGKGLNIWDSFCKWDGKVCDGQTGDVACDHYHRFEEDVEIMKEIGIKAYRFSISWARVLPNGTGKVNQKGIDFYNKLIDKLIEAGIEPFITLFHWDYPVALYDRGGWLNPDCSDWFAEYAKVVTESFSDRVKNFITFNEPICFMGLGYVTGGHAPGLKVSPRDSIRMCHNVLIAHGKAVTAIRENAKQAVKIGYAPNNTFCYPEDENNADDVEAARILSLPMKLDSHGFVWSPAWWIDPVVLGKYPDEMIKHFEHLLPDNWQEDMKTICQPLDFMGINIYEGRPCRMGKDAKPELIPLEQGHARTAIGWPVTPRVLKWGAIFLNERYNLPVIITENGMSAHDVVSADGKVHDPNRIDYLNGYIKGLREAADAGVKIDGYFQWSLMDNFEWSNGYKDRFGLVYVDYTTQKRIIKDSGYWYKKLIETNGESLI